MISDISEQHLMWPVPYWTVYGLSVLLCDHLRWNGIPISGSSSQYDEIKSVVNVVLCYGVPLYFLEPDIVALRILWEQPVLMLGKPF